MQREGHLETSHACELVGVSRASFYRAGHDHASRQSPMELRDAIQRIATANRFYGYRRVAAVLRQQGWIVNHKVVLRMLREDNLLCLRKRRYVLTTDSRHPFGVYPNLAKLLTLDRINQLWVADITYIRLREQFIYLAVILDAFSRKALGWAVHETLEAEVALAALERAMADRAVPLDWCTILIRECSMRPRSMWRNCWPMACLSA